MVVVTEVVEFRAGTQVPGKAVAAAAEDERMLAKEETLELPGRKKIVLNDRWLAAVLEQGAVVFAAYIFEIGGRAVSSGSMRVFV